MQRDSDTRERHSGIAPGQVKFRNLNVDPDSPVSQWPTEAVRAAIERGGLVEWRRLAEAVRSDPWGRTATQIEEVLACSRPYGTAELLERVLASARRLNRDDADDPTSP